MKRSVALIIIALMMATTFGCGGGGQVSSGTSTVKISIAGLKNAAAHAGLSARSASVANVLFTISAPDMQTQTSTVPVTGSDTISASFPEVPNGSNRRFFAAALAADNTVLSQGDAFSDLNGNLTNIEIVMGVDVSGEWTFTCTAQGRVPETDFIVFTQTGNSLSLVETTIGGSPFSGSGKASGNDVRFTVGGFACGTPFDLTAAGALYSDGSLIGTFTTTGGSSGTWIAVRGHIVPPPPPALGTVSGAVTDVVSGKPLDGVSVNLIRQGSSLVTVNTAAGGIYTVSGPAGGGYSLAFSKSGYVTKTVDNITIIANNTVTVNAALTPVSPPPASQGTITGTVTDALTGKPLDGVGVVLLNQGSSIGTTTTALDGTYTFSAAAGSGYSLTFSKSGYITSSLDSITITASTSTTVNAVLSPVLLAGQARIVLTWDYSKGNLDLDSHLKGPRAPGDSTSGPFQTWFGDMTYVFGGITYAGLDIDWISPSDGPVPQETTTIYQQVSGVYTFYVHDYTNGGSTGSVALSNSSAQVRVYLGNTLAATYNVPASQPGTVWTVFQLNGGALTPVNTMSSDETVLFSLSQRANLKKK